MKNIAQTPIVTPDNDMTLSAPTTAHIELTSGCVMKCRHCYNFWRHESAPVVAITREKLDIILDEIIKNKVMHVIFTGGEPLLVYDVLLYGVKKLSSRNISVSCNSNLYLATEEKMKKLKEAGLPHILTSLNSYQSEVNDFIVSKKGAFEKIINGIKIAVRVGLKISVNMIITRHNLRHIYKTAELSAKLGAKKFFTTRTVPVVSMAADRQKEFLLKKKELKFMLKELRRVRDILGLGVGGLIPFPFCFADYYKKYGDFYTHGCPAGNKMISINADGKAHACVHENESYGSVFDLGIKGVWKNMRKQWQEGDAFPDDCKKCRLFDTCNAGCRMMGKVLGGKISWRDNLCRGLKENKVSGVIHKINLKDFFKNKKFIVPATLKFRKEKGFYAIEKFGSEILCVKNSLAKIIIKYYKNKKIFTVNDVNSAHRDDLKELIDNNLIDIISDN